MAPRARVPSRTSSSHSTRRGNGIGRRVVERLLADLDAGVVSAFCDPQLAPSYERLGFAPTRQVVLHRRRP